MKFIHHKTLTAEKWEKYPFYKQILMIANELNRAKNMILTSDVLETEKCYERAFELIDITASTNKNKGILKELLRLRELMAETYILKEYKTKINSGYYNVLLSFTSESFILSEN